MSETLESTRPRTAFISGHIDLPESQFLQHYQTALDTAILSNDNFVVSNAGGADTLALRYLLQHGVSTERITIYLNSRLGSISNDTVRQALEKYQKHGLGVVVVEGTHTERDTIMTEISDYDILWIRSEEETRKLYGAKYRANRVSGTQKNRDRRA